jgi:hypothetical protein
VRRAKLYYLRDRHGKAAKIKERRIPRGKAAAAEVVEDEAPSTDVEELEEVDVVDAADDADVDVVDEVDVDEAAVEEDADADA